MYDKDMKIKDLEKQIQNMQKEVEYLHGLLREANIPYDFIAQNTWNFKTESDEKDDNQGKRIIPMEILPQHASEFYSFFKGRADVYSKRSGRPNPKTGKCGYYTQCLNFWKSDICPKKIKKQIKCSECSNQNYTPLRGKVLYEHLRGEKEDCSDVVGLYPMFPDETCKFLVFDFDNHDESLGDDFANTDNEWIEEVNAMRTICRENGVDILVERSRSGKGAHIWMFFEEAIPAILARRFGTALLTKGADSVNQKSFKSYDRMLPAQDHMPEGGLGNLIALPLQGQALKQGNSAFIDENWDAYPDQWLKLRKVTKISKLYIEEEIKEWGEEGLLGVLADDLSDEEVEVRNKKIKKKPEEKPWEKKKKNFYIEDVNGEMHITLANQIYIETYNLKPRLQNQIRRMAAFSNPEFYKNQAMGFSIQGIPRIISCGQDIDGHVCIPRGCKETLIQKLNDSGIKYHIEDERISGNSLEVSFNGELYTEQKKAAQLMLENEYGILCATTAFGKTAVGAYLIAERKVNTLILVHNTEIMKNWIEDIEKFLKIYEELPVYTTKTGRIRKRKSVIGKLYGGHNSITGIIDIAMISSLRKNGEVSDIVKNYGMVVMDECHHGGAQSAMDVLNEVNTKYIYGLTATPKRDDGQEKKVFMQFGPIRYRFTAKERATMQGIEHYIYPRFTRVVSAEAEKMNINDAYKLVVSSDIRNKQIVRDVEECLANNRTPLVLTKQKEHADILFELLKNKANNIFLLKGGSSSKEKDRIRAEMKNVSADESVVLVAIGQYIGEGFNYPRLDTMMLTMPISWSGNVEQYAGRLHRDYDGKKEVIIYDYVDSHIRVLEKMYHKRLRTYKKIGYKLCMNLIEKKQETNAIFDCESYSLVYDKDLQQANEQIIVSSPGLNTKKVKAFLNLIVDEQERGIKITVVTINPDNYPKNMIDKTKSLIEQLINAGINVQLRETMHEHFAIIDNEIVWYGSMNLLSGEKEEDNLMRVESKEIAQELMEMIFVR